MKNFNKIFIVMLIVCFLAGTVSATNITSLDFSTEGDWVQEDAIDGTDFESGVVKLHDSSDLVVNHIAGTVAPVTKTVTYGTVTSSLTGSNKCWITQNLGASQQATSATDATDASAGWYWQFNRKQGYKHDGTTRTPSSWDATDDNTYTGWDPNKDPCTLLLGAGWRLPTYAEWTSANSGWSDYTNTYSSVLKLHTSGNLWHDTGVLYNRGNNGYYWSSTEYNPYNGYHLYFWSGDSYTIQQDKPYGYTVRCIKDSDCPPPYPTSQSYYITTAVASQVDTSIWTGMTWVSITQTTPTDTSIKYLVSFDGRTTWKYWSGSVWTASSLANLQTEGMSKTVLETINESQWSSTGGFVAGTLDFAIDLGTTNPANTPKLNGISINYSTSVTPTYSTFTSEETTNFSVENDLENVTGMILAIIDKGKIEFAEDYEMNCKNQDYDTNIVIEDEFISVNTAALDESFNSSATITLEGVTCPVETITYQEGTFTSKDDIIAGGNNCELEGVCSNIQCTGTTLTFDVAHFTGFAAGSDANLTTQAEAGVFYPLDPIEFIAEYINSTDGTPISGECNITFDDDWDTEYTMDFDTDYNYTKSFATSGIHEYNITCSSANFVTLEANDTKLVSSVDIPEFSVITLGLGLIAVLVGLFIIRKKK